MLAIERQHRILDMLLKSGAVTTAKVAKVLAVSEETVRRDFEKLEADGHLFREHGGAVRSMTAVGIFPWTAVKWPTSRKRKSLPELR